MRQEGGRQGFTTLAIYLIVSVLVFGLRVIRHPATVHLGYLSDPSVMMWCMVWWPYALAHRLDPFITHAVWAPVGFNLTWATSIPALALALLPLTSTAGPIAAYNVAALAAPAVSGWSAFALCRHISGDSNAAFAGGLLYGFSPYEVGHVLAGHLSLTPIFIPPLCVLLMLKYAANEMSPRRFTIGLALLLIAQVLISPEILATMTILGACAMVIASALMCERRRIFAQATKLIVFAYGLAALVTAPFLYFMLAGRASLRGPLLSASYFSAAPSAIVMPSALVMLGKWTSATLARQLGNLWENGWYLSPPILLIAGLYLWRNIRQSSARLLTAMLAIVVVAGFGPALHAGGRPLFALPWKIVAAIPLLRNAMPVRLSVYLFLILAVVVALWFASPESRLRRSAFALLVLCYLPNVPLAASAQSRYADPAFFSQGLYRRFLRRNETVLVIPYGANGPSMLWQAQADMYFRMAGGYLGPTPAEFRRWPIVTELLTGLPVPDAAEQWRAFAAAHRIDAVVVADGSDRAAAWLTCLLGRPPIRVGGVAIHRLGSAMGGQATGAVTVAELQQRAAGRWFTMLLCAAGKYLNQGAPLSALNPKSARTMGFLPASKWSGSLNLLLASAAYGASNGLWLGPGNDGSVALGMFATPAAARSLIARYGAIAQSIRYPYPETYRAGRPVSGDMSFILINVSAAFARDRAGCDTCIQRGNPAGEDWFAHEPDPKWGITPANPAAQRPPGRAALPDSARAPADHGRE